MSFAHRELLILVLLLPALISILVVLYARRRQRVARALGDAGLIARLGAGDLARFPWARLWLLVSAAALLGVAAAGPHWGYRETRSEQRSRSVVLALDISRSMLAPDLSPNRLERERVLARRIVRALPTDRVGLVVFAGRAYVLAPLTSDHSALGLYIDALDPDIVSQGGSSLASAVRQAITLARGPGQLRGAAIVLITDGEALEEEEDAVEIAERAAQNGIRIHTVGLGTTAGDRIPEIDPRSGRVIGYKRDPYGDEVVTRLNEDLLKSIAQASGGNYYAATDAGAAAALLRDLRSLEQTALGTTDQSTRNDRSVWFIAAALLLLALDILLARRRETRALPPTSSTSFPATRAAALLLVFLVGNAFGIGDVERGNRYYRAGRYEEAVREYQKALSSGVNTPELHYNLGTALLQLGRYDEADPHLRAAVRSTDPELRQRAYYNIGNRALLPARQAAQGASEMLDAAIASYRQALRLDPADTDAKWNLELALREQEKQQNQMPQSGGGEDQRRPEDDEQSPARGSGSGNTPSQAPGGSGTQQGSRLEQRPMSREQADRILSAIEQDERQLTREKLRKGERRTPVARDW